MILVDAGDLLKDVKGIYVIYYVCEVTHGDTRIGNAYSWARFTALGLPHSKLYDFKIVHNFKGKEHPSHSCDRLICGYALEFRREGFLLQNKCAWGSHI